MRSGNKSTEQADRILDLDQAEVLNANSVEVFDATPEAQHVLATRALGASVAQPALHLPFSASQEPWRAVAPAEAEGEPIRGSCLRAGALASVARAVAAVFAVAEFLARAFGYTLTGFQEPS